MARVEDLVWKIAQPIVQNLDCSIYNIEFVKEGTSWFLRIYIDRNGGVGIDDCEAVSKKLSDMLDKSDPIPQSYYLEVSSPGLDRRLSRNEHFENSIGKEIEIKLFSPIDGKKIFTGNLIDYENGIIKIKVEDGSEFEIEKSKTADVRWIF